MSRDTRSAHIVAIILSLLADCTLGSVASAQTTTGYSYDGLGRLTAVSANDGTAATYALDPAGNRITANSSNKFVTSWEAESLPHQAGFSVLNGWAADYSTGPAYITYGPYAPVAVGAHTGTWRIAIDSNSGNQDVAHLDVCDSTSGYCLPVLPVLRSHFSESNKYQVFEIPFTVSAPQAGHVFEFRVYFTGGSRLTVDKVGYY